MTTSAGEISRRVQSLAGDTGKTFITDEDCWDWISDAQHQISKITECLTSVTQISAVADQEYYTMSVAVLRPLSVKYNGTVLSRTTVEQLDLIDPDRENGDAGVPTHYFIDGGQLGLWPRPSASGTNNITVRARILANTAILTELQTLQIPDYFREDIVRYCMLKMREKDEQPETMALLFQDWQHKIAISKDIANSPEADSYPAIRDVESMMDYHASGYD